eukprot:Nitzschia sp. Nitz4//scaffold35_size145790//116600//117271//NITZ4_003049-RA/size145790-processed-gene-0.245-mRNA-1//-1//CDS//3329549181//4561//frame0
MTELNEEACKMLVHELNQTKMVPMVYTMTKRSADIPDGFTISSCKVTSLTSKECTLSYTACQGDLCTAPATTTYTFNPPIQGDQVFLLQMQSRICSPPIHWLVTKPLALVILIACSLLSIAAMGLGVDGMQNMLAQYPELENLVSMIFGSPAMFAYLVLFAWCLTVVVHFIEATVAYRRSEIFLRFSNQTASLWGVLVFMAGYPIFVECQELVTAKREHAKKK